MLNMYTYLMRVFFPPSFSYIKTGTILPHLDDFPVTLKLMV